MTLETVDPEPAEAVPAVDLHCHFWPAEFLQAAHRGVDYFGTSAERIGAGEFRIQVASQGPVKARLPERDLDDAGGRIEERRRYQNIRMEAVMVSGFLWNYHLDEHDSAAYARSVNDELADVQSRSPAHIGLAQLPLPHTDAAIAEVERAVKVLGLRHFGVGSNFVGKNFDDPSVVPVLDTLAAAGATLSIHPVYFGTIGTPERLTSALLKGGLASPMEAGLAMATVITSGVLDRYPEFRVWVSHGGGTAMYAMGRLDRRWGAMEPRPTRGAVSDYLRRFWYGNLVHSDTQLGFLRDMVGADRITVGTDFPFEWDHLGGSANWVRTTSVLSFEERELVLWRGACEFLGGEPTFDREGST